MVGMAGGAHAQEASLCARVRLEIRQELAFERQAFDAEMVITNGLETQSLQDVSVEVIFEDDAGNRVSATSDPSDVGALFFIRVDALENILNVSGTGVVAPATTARINWLIVPSAAAAGGSVAGKRYFVGARLFYRLAGEVQEVAVAPDFITVRPQPELELDYFITRDVRADDPFTPEIEPAEPFSLGVRVMNQGLGTARNVRIQSAQPRIVENELGLLIGFEIVGSSVDDLPATPTLLMSFGDLTAGRSAVGRWLMTTTLSGQFTDFNARFTHADELGGLVTSLLTRVGAHLLVQDVRVDLPGRDAIRDFLARDGGLLRVYESEGIDTIVTDLSAEVALQAVNVATYRLDVPPTAGMLYAKFPDPHGGSQAIRSVRRSDGKVLAVENAWVSAEGTGSDTQHFFNVFDANGGGQYLIEFGAKAAGPSAPVIEFIPDRNVVAGARLTFIVRASDPDGQIPSLSIDARPLGATFVDEGNGEGVFDWQTTVGQVGQYPLTFRASDGVFTAARSALVSVQSTDSTATPTASFEPTAMATATPTWTESGTPTSSPSPTWTRTDTPTATPTETPTASPTETPSETATAMNTTGPGSTATATVSQASTPTETPTDTPSPAQTATGTVASSATSTAAATPTSGPPRPPSLQTVLERVRRVFGIGSPNIPPPLLEIWSSGPNGVAEAGTNDDELLGTGGTNAQGEFESSPGIAISRALQLGEMIYAIDRANNLIGPAVEVSGPAARPLGDACSAANECETGFCQNGVCCGSLCAAGQSCRVPGQVGVCAQHAVPAPTLSTQGILLSVFVLLAIGGLGITLRRRGVSGARG